MGEYRATITWRLTAGADFARGKYSREHQWAFDGGVTVPANVDPEEAFVASISSCHMLTFLWVASRRGFAVAGYVDDAVGVMTKNERGKAWVSKVTLDPKIEWGEKMPSAEELQELHQVAHEDCFIANSVKTEIVVAKR